MATLNNPINSQNIVDRYADFVVATANAGIEWFNNGPGSVAEPFPEFNEALLGSSSGRTIAISGASIRAPGTSRITAQDLRVALVLETNRYTNIRRLRARRLISTGPGNATRPASDATDETRVAHLAGTTYQGDIGPINAANVLAGQAVSATNLEQFFTNLRTGYNTVRGTAVQIDVSVCHSSCHGSCHGSRGRR